MKIGSAFPSQFLKADDLGDARPVVTIDRVVLEDIGGEQKPVLYFKGKDKGLVLNKTNADAIFGITGSEETDDWRGARITLFKTKVDFQGRRVSAIRVEDPPHSSYTKAPVVPPKAEVEAELPEEDQDVPFGG